MWSSYSTAKLVFLLLLVEASLGRYIPPDTYTYPDGNVTIKWDIMNQTRDTYSANVTIFNYLKKDDIEGTWELKWSWNNEEILMTTLGAKGTNHEGVSVGGVTVVDLSPEAEQIVPNCCKAGLIPSWFKEADLAKSSSSFQITVGRAGIVYYFPPIFASLTTPGSKYRCGFVNWANSTPGYLQTWKTTCHPYIPKKFNKIHTKEDL